MARRPSGLSGLTIADLQKEIARRARRAAGLKVKRRRLLAKLAALDALIGDGGSDEGASRGGRRGRRGEKAAGRRKARGGSRRGGGRKRPKNEMNLVEALQKLLKGRTLSVTDMTQKVQEAGYKTSAANFRTIVNQTLIKNGKVFRKVSRGMYTAA